MYKSAITQCFFLIMFILLSGCGGNSDVLQINELSSNTVSYDETIHINNCGGKADSEQTASRSFATSIEGAAEFSAGYQSVIEGRVSAKYNQYRNVSKSQRLIAPPATNMEFILRWSDEVHAGNVTVNGITGTYKARIPVTVDQVSSQDLGCGKVQIQESVRAAETPKRTIQIGFDFTYKTPERPAGDDAAPTHLFIHLYPMPSTGYITGMIYLNDKELFNSPEAAEVITLLILRPIADGWRVIHRVTIIDDESQSTTAGITTVNLNSPLPVEKGDVFAHWQLEAPAGPIPLNVGNTSTDGLSIGDFGFSSADMEVGKIISGHFSGPRDYFINVIFEPAP